VHLHHGSGTQFALDYIVQRERAAAAREGQQPNLTDPRIRDNTYSYLLAGQDTTAGANIWCIRHLLSYPEWQRKIHSDLHVQYAAAYSENRVPTAAELVAERSPVLDAFIDEVLRLSTGGYDHGDHPL